MCDFGIRVSSYANTNNVSKRGNYHRFALLFSFNHSPAIYTLRNMRVENMVIKRQYKGKYHIIRHSCFMLLIFTMFFVFSCILLLDSTDFAIAREANIPILSYFANKLDNPIIGYGVTFGSDFSDC